ncbi:MAG: hypothetical protein IKI72_03260 [Bacteroidales bacterium]|nr:hypothetical protein [Bacteroidales bacterium]
MKRISLLFLFCCMVLATQAQTSIEFGNARGNGARRSVDFKFMRNGQKQFIPDLEIGDLVCTELTAGTETPLSIDSLLDISRRSDFSRNIDILILADKSANISLANYLALRESIVAFASALPKTAKIYIAAIGDEISPTERVYPGESIENYVKSDAMTTQAYEQLSIYSALISKIQEINNVPPKNRYLPDVGFNAELATDSLSDKYFFIFTGDIDQYTDASFYDAKLKFANNDYTTIPEQLKAIYCVYFGERLDQEMQNEMLFICHRADEGKIYPSFSADSLTAVFAGSVDSVAMDYRLVYSIREKTTYNGQTSDLRLKADKYNATGDMPYALGSVLAPLVVLPGDAAAAGRPDLLQGLIAGLVCLAVLYLILQFLLPFLLYRLFRLRHVKTYNKSRAQKDHVLQQCYYCKGDFEDGDVIVTKCQHTVHIECWEENQNRCPEYGINNCKEGIYYYNKKNLADRKNAPNFTKWMLCGLVAGLLAWMVLQLILPCHLFDGLIGKITTLFQRDQVAAYAGKITPLLWGGALLGFFTTLVFSFLSEFRKKTVGRILQILGRSVGNAVMGFLAFLIGSIAIIAVGKVGNCLWLDWVPWLLFGIAVTWLLAVKSEISTGKAVLGSLIAAALTFAVIYLIKKDIIGVYGFMLYAALLGAIIAIVQYASENYFLHVEGSTKERDIAIYKWMNAIGGAHHVTIGSSPDCVIAMTWDKSENIAAKQLELYIENDLPFAKALAGGTVMNDNGQTLEEGSVVRLSHGDAFTIGATTFTYIEKDK